MSDCFNLGCNGCEQCIDPQDAEEIPPDWWVVIEPNGGKCHGGKTLAEATLAAVGLQRALSKGLADAERHEAVKEAVRVLSDLPACSQDGTRVRAAWQRLVNCLKAW